MAKDVLVNGILVAPVAYAGKQAELAKGAQALGQRVLTVLQAAAIGMSKAEAGDDDLSLSGAGAKGEVSSTSNDSSGTGTAQGGEGVSGMGMFTYGPNRYGTPFDRDMSYGLTGGDRIPNPAFQGEFGP